MAGGTTDAPVRPQRKGPTDYMKAPQALDYDVRKGGGANDLCGMRRT